jgi:hypothetical protein
MEARDIVMKNAIEKIDVNAMFQLVKQHGLTWLNTKIIDKEAENFFSQLFRKRSYHPRYRYIEATPLCHAVTRNSHESMVALVNAGATVNSINVFAYDNA